MRRRYLVTYDVSNDKRLRATFLTMRAFGDHVQYSVFLCELSDRERVQLETRLGAILNHREDQALVIDLGPADRECEAVVSSVGRAFEPPTRAFIA